jgi:hypothetical protein
MSEEFGERNTDTALLTNGRVGFECRFHRGYAKEKEDTRRSALFLTAYPLRYNPLYKVRKFAGGVEVAE